MTIDERMRHEMYSGLEEHLGAEVADALMQHLPPSGWADVATKRDLDALENRMDLKLAALQSGMEASMQRIINRYMLWLFPTILTALGLATFFARVA